MLCNRKGYVIPLQISPCQLFGVGLERKAVRYTLPASSGKRKRVKHCYMKETACYTIRTIVGRNNRWSSLVCLLLSTVSYDHQALHLVRSGFAKKPKHPV